MDIVSYGGWDRCARLSSGEVELIVTLDVGPRIIRFGFTGGPNEFFEAGEDAGNTGGDEFHIYGGHRLWVAPEIESITLQPDNAAVEVTEESGVTTFRTPTDRWHVQKELRISFPKPGLVQVDHRVYNRGAHELQLASWGLSMMAPGGVAYFPMPEFQSHTDEVLPDRPLALWAYTDLSDPRWTWSQSLGRLRQDSNLGPQKIGMYVDQVYAAYANRGNLFFKSFEAEPDEEYPDFGCNFETFTNERFLEIESLGPVKVVGQGDYACHRERWCLLREDLPAQASQIVARLDGLRDDVNR